MDERAVFDAVLMRERSERTVSAREVEAKGGMSVPEIETMIEAFGLPVPEPDQPAFTPEEAEVFARLKDLEAIWPPEVGVQAGRVYGRLLARIAQTEFQLFRVYVLPRLQASSPEETLRAARDAFEALLPLADPLIKGVHRRWLEHELAQEAVASAESGGSLSGEVDVTFLFCDLKDFTAFADTEGDTAAVTAIDHFADSVIRRRGPEFRFMKSLGDGFMLVYGDVCTAVRAAVRIMRSMQVPRMPRVHASVHRGVAIVREGDYFGRSVNIAARLLNAADRDELVVTAGVVEACGDEFDWERVGMRKVRGVADLVEVHRLLVGEGLENVEP
ncbi:MAG TPA: adenylate/guanylate cyclase domain-containing protein [Thermoleophilaceae bacterium]|jgi:adenylate cyclase